MTDYDRFDVLTALFPFIDVPVRKPRPVLVLSARSFNALHGHVVAAMITTGAGSRWPSDCAITDLTAAGLGHASVVRLKVFTLAETQIGRRIGRLSEADEVRFAAVLNPALCGANLTSP